MKHKHYDVIVAAASGQIIQYRVNPQDSWEDYSGNYVFINLSFLDKNEYRVKPQPVEMWQFAYKQKWQNAINISTDHYTSLESFETEYYPMCFEWIQKLDYTKIVREE